MWNSFSKLYEFLNAFLVYLILKDTKLLQKYMLKKVKIYHNKPLSINTKVLLSFDKTKIKILG